MTIVLRLLTVAASVIAATAAAVPASAQSAAPSSSLQLLDVPYLPQSEALCGGAAVAMVMRYWGATGIYAESFASLVDPRAKGIRGADLITSLTGRGWTARPSRVTRRWSHAASSPPP